MNNRTSNLHQDPVTQAAEFFIEFRAGDGTPAIRARFEKWLRASPENVQAYLEIAGAWSELPTSDPESRIDVQALLATASDAKADNVVDLEMARARVAIPSPYRTWRGTLAGCVAVLLVVIVGAAISFVRQRGSVYETGIGEQRMIILEDGSTVMLNALTTVRVQMARQSREVVLLRGQAYFHDTEEPGRPFTVRAGRSIVRAIGTEFSVAKEPDQTVVTVIQGRVAVTRSIAWLDSIERGDLLRDLAAPAEKLREVVVSAGEQIIVLPKNIPVPNRVDVATATAWMQQRLVFDNTPLEKVAEQFNLYSKRPLVIADPELQTIGLSGDYAASDPAALIGFLRSQPTMRVIERDDKFIITRR